MKDFLAKFNISTHAIGVAVTGFVGAYAENDSFRDTVNGYLYRALMGHPKISGTVFGVVAILLAYKGSHSAKGVQEMASKIENAQSAPKP